MPGDGAAPMEGDRLRRAARDGAPGARARIDAPARGRYARAAPPGVRPVPLHVPRRASRPRRRRASPRPCRGIAAGAPGATDADARAEAAGRRWASARAIAGYLEARRRSRAGDATGAVDALRLAVAYDETSAELRVSLAAALSPRSDRLDAAEGEARRALELAGGGGRTASEAHVLLARLAVARDRLEEATLGAPPGDPDRDRARRARRARRPRAVAAPRGPVPRRGRRGGGLEGARGPRLARRPARPPACASSGGRSSTAAKPGARRALACGAPRSSIRPTSTRSACSRRAHDALGRAGEARDDHLAILRREPDDAPALVALGRLAVRAGDAERGARVVPPLHARAARDGAEAHLRIALEWLEAGGRPTRSPRRALAVAELGPDGRLRFAEGLALLELRRFAEAAPALAGRAGDGSRVLGPGARRARGRALARRPSR